MHGMLEIATRTVLSESPGILCLQLGRWLEDSNTKLLNQISIDRELQLNSARYRLVAVIRHHGRTLKSGHYTTLIATPTKWGWDVSNDGTMTQNEYCRPRKINEQAYVFI